MSTVSSRLSCENKFRSFNSKSSSTANTAKLRGLSVHESVEMRLDLLDECRHWEDDDTLQDNG